VTYSTNSQNILILAAHPDDEVLGCGGVIQYYTSRKDNVYVCVVTDGSSSQYQGDIKKAQAKDQQTLRVQKFLGIKEFIRLDFPDMKLDTIAHIDINRKLENVINQIKPSIIYTHSSTDVNLDHILVYQSTKVVTRPGKPFLDQVYSYEVLSSTEWSRDNPFNPNTYFDISSYIEKKVKAFNLCRTEIRPYPHPRSAQGVKSLAKYRGIQSGFKYAESFQLIVSYNHALPSLG